MDEYNVNQTDSDLRKHAGVMDNCDLSPEDDQASQCDQTYPRNDDLLLANSIAESDVAAYLASSGMAGIAAASAISSSRSRNKAYTFETIPAVRKRQATRLLRKLQTLIEEYNVRVGQQAVVLVCNPRVAHKAGHHMENQSSSSVFKVYGSSPLEGVVRNLRPILVQELDTALHNIQLLHEQTGGANSQIWTARDNETLPPLMVDGIPTPLDKMTQAQLRAFIPVMLKYSTNRGKPGWGRPQARPPWWPEEVPWANVRSDVRSAEEKAHVSWTAALKKVVRMCYEYHGREDLLADYSNQDQTQMGPVSTSQLIDMENPNPGQPSQFIIGHHPPPSDVNDPSHNNMYAMMHMPTSEGMSQSRYEHYSSVPSYSFKTMKDGTISIVRIEDTKNVEQQTLDAAAALEEYNNENVKYQGTEDLSMNNFNDGGEMVSIPPGSMMNLDPDSSAALYQLISNSRHKQPSMSHTPNDQNHVSDNL